MSPGSNEYKLLKLCFAKLFDMTCPNFDFPADVHPMAVLNAFELSSPSKARKSLEIGLNDLVEMTLDWHADAVSIVDAELAAAGLPTLSKLRQRFSRQYRRIAKRGVINTMEEYYLIKGLLDGGFAEDGAEKLMHMMTAYEESNPRQ